MDEIASDKIKQICIEYEAECRSGRLYITQKGLNKVAKMLGGKYSDLSRYQKKRFRLDCVCEVQDSNNYVKSWVFYTGL
jgi:hypothetical protein